MSQVFVQQNTLAAIPPSWEPPKYQLGQAVKFPLGIVIKDPKTERCYSEGHGIITGINYRGLNSHPANLGTCFPWEYTVTLNPKSPGWHLFDGMSVLEEDEVISELVVVAPKPEYSLSLSACNR